MIKNKQKFVTPPFDQGADKLKINDFDQFILHLRVEHFPPQPMSRSQPRRARLYYHLRALR